MRRRVCKEAELLGGMLEKPSATLKGALREKVYLRGARA